MNDFSENELLSAYLDGELTAAERAEVERLLAADPAAQQALDQLRTLSATLQALPPRELGEDLSRQVLREAQRRMLNEGEPGERELSSAPPVPLTRSVFRRFVNRRTVVWLALTAAIAVMITINERQHRTSPADNSGRELARAPAAREALVHGPLPPSSIQAAPGDIPRSASSVAPPVEKKLGPASPAAARKGEVPSIQLDGQWDVRNRIAEESQLGAGGPTPAKRERFADKAPGRSAAKKQKNEAVLVVRCDISPQAAKSEAFDKLLDANGVVWYLERRPSGGANDADQKQAAAAGETLVYAEATPAQLKAVLAGLEAQPEVFLAVSVKPPKAGGGETGQESAAVPAGPSPAGKAPAEEPGQARPLAEAETQRQLRLQSTRQQVAQSPPRQRVLFVVRVIGRDQPPAAEPARRQAK